MRPPYSKQLLARREKGDLPWLAIVVVGSFEEMRHARAELGKIDKGAAWLLVPDELQLLGADWLALLGLDVLVVPYGDARRCEDVMREIWHRARPATLWRWHGGGACRVLPIQGSRDLVTYTHKAAAVDRRTISSWRENAELFGDGPLFDDERFFKARAELGRRMGLSDDTVRLLNLGQPMREAA